MEKENNLITGVCVDLTHMGLGIIKEEGYLVFVPNLLIGEKAKVKITKEYKTYCIGEVVKRITSSTSRVNPICKYFHECGGCDLMHMNYHEQLNFKLDMVNQTFKRIGKVSYTIKKINGSNDVYEYRNKVSVPFRFNGKKVICGFYKKKTHDIIEFDKCYLQTDLSTDIIRFIRNLLNEYKIIIYNENTRSGLFRHVLIRKNSFNEYMVVFITRSGEFKFLDEIVSKIQNRYQNVVSVIRNINNTLNNTILGNEVYYATKQKVLKETLCGLEFEISYNSFFQINHKQTELLYNKVLEFSQIKENDVVVDCYCGVGTITLLLAKTAKKVYGIEIIEEAIKNAIENKKRNKITSEVNFICGKAEEELEKIEDDIDLLVVDPPRKGLEDAVINAIINKKIKRIVYVSCDCATLARDLEKLSTVYKIINGEVFDMFPQTKDAEVIVCLEYEC